MLVYLKYIPILIASLLVGNWFLKEVRKAQQEGAPWYRPYTTVPGLIVLIALLLPLFFWILRQ